MSPVPSRTRQLLHASLLCYYFYTYSLLYSQQHDIVSTYCTVAPRPLSAELLPHQVTLPVQVWTVDSSSKLELCICLVNRSLFQSVYPICQDLIGNLSKVTSNTFSIPPSLVQSAEVGTLICLPSHISAGKFRVAVLHVWIPEPFQQPSD